MLFEKVKNFVGTEEMLLELISKELQANYSAYFEQECYFLKLEKVNERYSKIAWFKTFPDSPTMKEYYCDSKFHRASIMVNFKGGVCRVCCQGRTLFNIIEVWPTHVIPGDPTTGDRDIEKCEQFLRAFEEIAGALAASKKAI